MYFAKKKKKRGFTLIELLVVIAIIGILATIVIVNVNSARSKAQNTAIKGSLDSLRASAEIYYDSQSPTQYGIGGNTGFCISPDGLKASSTITAIQPGFVCNASTTAYAAGAMLKVAETGGQYWCIDSTGNSKIEVNPLGAVYACP